MAPTPRATRPLRSQGKQSPPRKSGSKLTGLPLKNVWESVLVC